MELAGRSGRLAPLLRRDSGTIDSLRNVSLCETGHPQTTKPDISRMSMAERIQLGEDLRVWSGVAAKTADPPLTEAK